MADFPSFFVLQAPGGGPYLGVQESSSSDRLPGLLKFSESNVWGPRSKFAMERTKTGDGRLLLAHIKSCFNNKYWILVKTGDEEYRITASADKTNEERGNAACTMFEIHGSNVYPGYNFQTRSFPYLYLKNVDGFFSVGRNLKELFGDYFPTLDSRNLLVLPSQVSFRTEGSKSKSDEKKSDDSDVKYLCSRVIQRYNYHKFESDVEVADPVVAHQLFPTNDGNYRIKDLHFGKFWRRSPNWIWADAHDGDYSNDTVFSFVKVTDKVVAIRNLGNNMFIGGLTTEGKTDCLNAHYPTITKETRLMVEERVLQRVIKDLKYRLDERIIYDEEIGEVGNGFATNESPTGTLTVSQTFTVNESATTSWNNSVSLEIGVKVEFDTALVPLIEESKVEMSANFGYTHEWGGSETKTHDRNRNYSLEVPPLTTLKATLMCTTASCDIPFSYTQRDLLPSGEWVETIKDDGMYKGINSYNFYVTVTAVDK